MCLLRDLGIVRVWQKHPYWNLQSLSCRVENDNCSIAPFWPPQHSQAVTIQRMKRIENPYVCNVCTQGIVRGGGCILTFIAWSPPAA